MRSLEDIIQLRLWEVLEVLKLSRILRTGLARGLSKDRECFMAKNQCRNLVKTLLTLQSLIREALNYPFLQMYLTEFKPNGPKTCPTLTALQTRLSAKFPETVPPCKA